MKRVFLRFSLLAACAFVVSCASERKVSYEKSENEQFGDRYMSDVEYEEDKEGNWLPTKGSDKRSSYEGNSYAGAKGGYQGAQYSTDAYRKKRWSGDGKGYNTKAYNGGSDSRQFYDKPYFVDQANAQGQSAYVGDGGYSTGSYSGASNAASRGANVRRPVDAKVSAQKAKSPSKIHEYYKKDGDFIMGIDDTKELMGR